PGRNFPGNKSAATRSGGGVDHDFGIAVGFTTRKRVSDWIDHSQGRAAHRDHHRGLVYPRSAADFVSAGEGGRGFGRYRSVRDWLVLGDVCLFRVECVQLYYE